MAEQKIKAVIFDLGETLLNFGRVNTLKYFYQGAQLSYDFLKSTSQKIPPFPLYAARCLLTLKFRNIISNITGNDFDATDILDQACKKYRIKLDQNQLTEFVWLWYQPLSKAAATEPDLQQTLEKLKNSGLKLGILSNTFVSATALERHLAQVVNLDIFDIKLYSYQFKYRKPNPLVFIDAADRIGEKLSNIAYVGDRINNDINPALNLEMTAILKKAYTNNGKKLPKAAYSIRQIKELPELIERINAE